MDSSPGTHSSSQEVYLLSHLSISRKLYLFWGLAKIYLFHDAVLAVKEICILLQNRKLENVCLLVFNIKKKQNKKTGLHYHHVYIL